MANPDSVGHWGQFTDLKGGFHERNGFADKRKINHLRCPLKSGLLAERASSAIELQSTGIR